MFDNKTLFFFLKTNVVQWYCTRIDAFTCGFQLMTKKLCRPLLTWYPKKTYCFVPSVMVMMMMIECNNKHHTQQHTTKIKRQHLILMVIECNNKQHNTQQHTTKIRLQHLMFCLCVCRGLYEICVCGGLC